MGKPKEEEIEVEDLEEFDPSYEMKGIVEELLKTGLTSWNGQRVYRAKVKGVPHTLRISISAVIEEVKTI